MIRLESQPIVSAICVGLIDDEREHPRVEQLTRERVLSHVLGIQVIVDRTGWVRGDPEVLIHREPDGRIYPLSVKVSPDTPVDELVGERPVNARFTEYNQLLQVLRHLAERAAAEVVRLAPAADSAIASAHHDLSRFGDIIAERQARTMGSGVMRLVTLDREIEVLRRWEMVLTPVIVDSEKRTPERRPDSHGFIARAIGLTRWLRGAS